MTIERCPYCGAPVIGPIGAHIAFNQPCQAAQINDVLWPDGKNPA